MADPKKEPHEYCVVHDQPIDWCKHPDRCREIMRSWGLYDIAEAVRADIEESVKETEALKETDG